MLQRESESYCRVMHFLNICLNLGIYANSKNWLDSATICGWGIGLGSKYDGFWRLWISNNLLSSHMMPFEMLFFKFSPPPTKKKVCPWSCFTILCIKMLCFCGTWLLSNTLVMTVNNFLLQNSTWEGCCYFVRFTKKREGFITTWCFWCSEGCILSDRSMHES